jgi:hypothetical protein
MKTPGDYLYRTPRPTRHPGRVAAACFLAAGLLMLAADRACADEFVALAGYGTTSGLGERTGAPEASLSYLSRHVALEGSWYGAAKLESGAGFGVRGAAEARWQGLGAGLAYSYRDGGAWSKAAPWARVSAGAGPVRLIGEAALGGRNRERKVDARGGSSWSPGCSWSRTSRGRDGAPRCSSGWRWMVPGEDATD